MRRSGVPVIDRVIGGLAPGLPLVLAGPSGSGRTVLALQVADAALRDHDIVVILAAEPPGLLLQQAATLGLSLDRAAAGGQLILLELDPRAPSSLYSAGARSLVEAILAEHPSTSLIVVDPFTALTVELADETPMRAVARELVAATPRTTLVLTVESAAQEGPVERVLAEVCGSFVRLARDESGRRTATLRKTRAGAGAAESVEFRIDARGAELIGDLRAREAAREPAPAAPEPAPAERPAPTPAVAREPAPSAAPARRRILVIDDDAALRAEWSAWLGERYDVVCAADGFEAMAALLRDRPDLIVLDLVLPRVSGYEVLTALHPLAQTTPILGICDEIERRGDRLGPLVLGAADVLAKPVPRFELLHKVETLLHLAGSRPALVDPADAKALFGVASPSRPLEQGEFRERVRRACDFGARFDIPSAVVAVAAPSAEAADSIVAAAESALRQEDAVLVISKRRCLLLLVAAERAQGPAVVERLARRALGERAARGVRCHAVDARDAAGDWGALFAELGGDTAEES